MHWPEPTTEEPTLETIVAWIDKGGWRATDSCWLEHDQPACEHGYPSWAVVLDLPLDLTET